MGVGISQVGSSFYLPVVALPGALAAVRALNTREFELTGRYGFAWMRDSNWYTLPTLYDVLREWMYIPAIDEAGNIIGLDFEGEKLGDEFHLFNAIAPFVKAGSYIEVVADEGERWRWVFDGRQCVEKHARVSFD